MTIYKFSKDLQKADIECIFVYINIDKNTLKYIIGYILSFGKYTSKNF